MATQPPDREFPATAGVPDPTTSLFRDLGPQAPAQRGRAWVGQRSRRSRIYAAARALLKSAGYEGVHMQDIAARCEISAQTIYNLVGSKAQVLEQAAADWVEGIHTVAVARARELQVNTPYLMIELFWESALSEADWVRVSSAYSSAPRDPLTRAFYRASESALRADLDELKRRGALRADADPPSLARQLTALAHVTITRWCAEPGDVAAYRRDLHSGPGAILRASLQGEELTRLERYMADHRAARPVGGRAG